MTVSPKKWKYASSTRTAACGAASMIRSSSVTPRGLAGGTVGIGDGDEARRRRDGVEQRSQREAEAVFRRNVNDRAGVPDA